MPIRQRSNPPMTPRERQDWLYEWIVKNEPRGFVNVLSRDFSDAYIEATKAPHRGVSYGAHKCPQLGQDLKELWEQGRLRRHRTGLPYDMRGMGFPLWVWDYSLGLRR